jgi:asparagine synthase (glutamine-hydrolysing)
VCGICGIVYHDAQRRVTEEQVQRMSQTIRHRGPDDSGSYIQNNVGLGFRRLAIIDLSPTGHQPMSNEDGTVWIIFNGEIYNYPALREELIGKGHQFRSHSDTETILHLWEEEGDRCVERLRGMFAFALWDANRQTLFLARDREGKKPLFYAHLNDRLLFGSEIKTILQDPDFKAEPDIEAIHHYLAYQSVPAPYSAFKGVKKLPPAHTLLYKNGQISLRRYWNLSYKQKRLIRTPHDELTLQEEIIDRLREAVKIRLMSEVPLGAFLSGGIDSSIVVALMAGLMDQPVKTFSIGFT